MSSQNLSYSLQVTSSLPIQNGPTATSCCGPSSSDRPASDGGLPIRKVPPATGTISKVTLVPGIVSTYGFRSVGGSAARPEITAASSRAVTADALTAAPSNIAAPTPNVLTEAVCLAPEEPATGPGAVAGRLAVRG